MDYPYSGTAGTPLEEERSDTSKNERLVSIAAIGVPLLLHLICSVWIALLVPFPAPIDELQHVSFVAHMDREPRIFPAYSSLVVPSEISGNPDAANYLNHPSLYYLALAGPYQPENSVAVNVLRMRLANVAITTAGLFLMLLAAATILRSSGSRLVFGITLVMFPKLGLVSGLVNNDSLGILATGLTFLGATRFLTAPSSTGPVLWGAGLALAGWIKLTVLVMLGSASAILLMLVAIARKRLPMRALLILAGVSSLGSIPTLANLIMTGKVLFVSSVHNFVPVADRPDFSVAGFAVEFLGELARKWPAAEPAGPLHLLALSISLLLGVVALVRFLPPLLKRLEVAPAAYLASALLLAVPVAVSIHATYGYWAYKAIGDLTSAQPRYYYPLWPGVALACALLYADAVRTRLFSRRAIGLSALAVGGPLAASSTVMLPLFGIES